MVRKRRKVSTKPVGNAILRKITQLKRAKLGATDVQKRQIDLSIRVLKTCYQELKMACKGTWLSPN